MSEEAETKEDVELTMSNNDDVTVTLHRYEVDALIRLLGRHIVGPDSGPRGILAYHMGGVLMKLMNAIGKTVDDMFYVRPYKVKQGVDYDRLYLLSDYDESV